MSSDFEINQTIVCDFRLKINFVPFPFQFTTKGIKFHLLYFKATLYITQGKRKIHRLESNENMEILIKQKLRRQFP